MHTQSRVLKWSLIIGMVIVLNLFFNYALSLIYKSPTYEDFCPVEQVNPAVDNQAECVAGGGQWNANQPVPGDNTAGAGYCNLQFTCGNNFAAAQKIYDRNVFLTLVILGAICIAIGNFLNGNVVISIALSLAGVLSFVIASMRYWSSADNVVKLIILAIALGLLVWVAMKKFKNN